MSIDHQLREAMKGDIDTAFDTLEELDTAVRKMISLRDEVTTGTHMRGGWDLEVSAAWEKLRELTR